MVAEIRDKSRVENQILNSTINSSFYASAVRQQNLFAESTAGYGGAINGVGALAKVYDGTKGSLSARTLFNGNSVSADISLTTNNRPDIKVKSYGAGAEDSESVLFSPLPKPAAWSYLKFPEMCSVTLI